MSESNQGDCTGRDQFIGKSGVPVRHIYFRCLPIIRGLDKVTYRTSQPWKQNANVADVLPSAALAANRAIERMINQSPPT